ncbi:MAG: 30S ribosomal protein S1 [Candidatus Moranbacteria bacterium CG10_big_fil_rev_8_21_14_0_10_35_21]|nr:MAG: 30S ribosomal protein S1 [Candidatus Moranbacteria bacterium CG10_big_fil_rev_8_21_14_0_10_35_21]PJA88642.1 MAG: 30S ribosomal protein S1 [Candidatus Moranbacteria bacterium CG_4_9_14_3_um_filter_36_9]
MSDNIYDKLADEVDKIDKKSVKQSDDMNDTSEKPSVMAALLSENQTSLPAVGDSIIGEIIDIAANSVFVGIDPFGTGIVLGKEIKDGMGTGKLKIGDKISAVVIDQENDEGFIELSIREASYEKAWDNLEDKRDSEEKVFTKVLSANKGGLLIELNGISGFLPVSQLSSKNYPRVEDGDKNKIFAILKKLVGQELEVRILDADRETEKLIVSEKAAQKEKDRETVSSLKIGDVVEGEISGVVDFGAFIKFVAPGKDPAKVADDKKLEGLVHISELAWQLIENPRDVVKVGSKVKAKIIAIDDYKISLSIRALEKDPWSEVDKKYKVGDIVDGTAHKINRFGIFVYLDQDIHGLAHISEMAEVYPGKNLDELVKAGEKYLWKILSVEPATHRMGLVLAKKGDKSAPAKKEKAVKEEKATEKKAEKKPKKVSKKKVEKEKE